MSEKWEMISWKLEMGNVKLEIRNGKWEVGIGRLEIRSFKEMDIDRLKSNQTFLL